jgi:FAD/FMN-containing dehydrogenase
MAAAAVTEVSALFRDLAEVVGEAGIVTELAEREAHSADVYSRGATCLAVVRPGTREQLAQVVARCVAAGCAVLPRGGGLTYSSGYMTDGAPGIVLDVSRLDRIVDLNPDDMYITVEAGATWKSIHEALRPHGLRLPCFGTFSGAAATVGGGLSSGALFFGTARYGTAADSVLGLEVALASGQLMRTGQGGLRNVSKPAYRTYGPDLTGPFIHDCGVLGIKTQATFRLIRAPKHTGYASFAFETIEAASAALSEVARAGLAEDAYVFDRETTRNTFAGVDLRRGLRTMLQAARSEDNVLRGTASAAKLAWAGRRIPSAESFSLHLVCAAHGAASLREDLEACAAIAGDLGGDELPDLVPREGGALRSPRGSCRGGPDTHRPGRAAAGGPRADQADDDRVVESLLQLRARLHVAGRVAAAAPARAGAATPRDTHRAARESGRARGHRHGARADHRGVRGTRRGVEPDRSRLSVCGVAASADPTFPRTDQARGGSARATEPRGARDPWPPAVTPVSRRRR